MADPAAELPPIFAEDACIARFRDIVAAPDVECLRAAVLAAAGDFGFQAVYYLSPVSRDRTTGRNLTSQGFPDSWSRQYRRRLRFIDPLPDYAMTLMHVFRWGSVLETLDLTPAQQRYHQLLQDVGMGDGLAMAVWGPGGRCGFIGFGMPVDDSAFRPQSYIGVGLIGQMSFNRYCSLIEEQAAGSIRLSPRELEILHWASRGKSNVDMAEIIGISRGTVDTYMRRVFRKFGTNDRTVACIRAHELGFIHATGVEASQPTLH